MSIRIIAEQYLKPNVRRAGDHMQVIDVLRDGGKLALCVCIDCGQTWLEGAEVPDFPRTCAAPLPRGYTPPPVRTDYLIALRLPGVLRILRYWTGDGWADEAVNAVRFADWKSANNVCTNVLQPFTHNTGARAEIIPEIVT